MGTVIQALTILFASDFTVQDKPPKIEVEGNFQLHWVYRDGALNEASAWQRNGVLSGAALDRADDSNDIFSGKFTLTFKTTLPSAVDVFLQLENKQIMFTPGTFPSEQNINLGIDDIRFYVEQAYVRFREFAVAPNSSLTFGAQDFIIDLTGRGNTIFVDASEAESPWDDAEFVWPLTRRQTMEPTGFVFAYEREALDFRLAALPAVLERNRAVNNDHAIWAMILGYKLTEGFKLGMTLATFDGPQKSNRTSTLGIGYNWQIQKGFDFWGEFYAQAGRLFDSLTVTLPTGAATLTQVKTTGKAFDLGLRFTVFETPSKPFIDLSVVKVDGAKNQSTITGQINETKTKKFISYENNDDFLIIESNEWGYDIDNNYIGFKLKLGATFSVPGDIKGNLPVTLKAAFFKADNPIRTLSVVDGLEKSADDLGIETNFNMDFKVNKWCDLNFMAALLSGSDVMKMFTKDTESGTWLLALGTTLKF